MKFLIISFLLGGFYSHDIQVAFFKIHQDDENFVMEIVIEKDDLESTFTASDINLTDKHLQDYLQENLSVVINKEEQILCFEKMKLKNKHVYLTCNIHEFGEEIKSIELTNTCLLNIGNHSNIVEIRLDDRERDFLMNKERTTITVNY